MKNNNFLVFGMFVLGGIFLFKDQLFGATYGGSGGGEKFFNVPGVGPVPESRLPSLGYSFIFGKWLTPEQTDIVLAEYRANTGRSGVDAGDVANWLKTLGPVVFGILEQLPGNDAKKLEIKNYFLGRGESQSTVAVFDSFTNAEVRDFHKFVVNHLAVNVPPSAGLLAKVQVIIDKYSLFSLL